MWAVILAGGFGTRLRPLTYRFPKPMIPVRGKPFLEYIIGFLRRQKVLDVVLCLHYMADRFVSYFEDGGRFGIRIAYSFEKVPLGTAGAVKNARKWVKGTFFLLNGDTYLDVNLWDALEYHRGRCALATMVLTNASEPGRYGLVELAEDGCVLSFREKASLSSGGYVNAGVYVFEPEILDYIPEGVGCSLERDVFPGLFESGELYGYPSSGYFIDIGTPEDYRRFEKDLGRRFKPDH